MAMAREAQNAPKGAASKQPLKRKSKSAVFQSAERVADSEIESETESESSAESVNDSIKPAPFVKKLNGHKKLEDSSSSEEESEEQQERRGSTDDEESEQEDDEKNKENSYEEDEDEDGEYDERGPIGDTETLNRIANASSREIESQSTSSESGDSTGSETDEEGESEGLEDPVTVGVRPSHASIEPQVQSIPPEPVKPFKPPEGFEPLSTSDDRRMKVVDIFSAANLTGKQLWYITAPASVPISSVKHVSLEDVQLGKPALSINGYEYGFIQETAQDRGRNSILIPDKDHQAYCIGRKAIDQILHLQRIVTIAELPTTTLPQTASSQISTSSQPNHMTYVKRPARKQPENLRMRFRPIGFGDGKSGTIGSSSSSSDSSSSTDNDKDAEMEDDHPEVRLHKRPNKISDISKRRPTPKDSPMKASEPSKRKRKGLEDGGILKSPAKSRKRNSNTSPRTPKAQRS